MREIKIVFIIPYFGRFNNYFQLFLNSCKNNPTITWIIYTDDKTDYDYPKNVIVKYATFENIRKKFQSKFNFKIALDVPYKLCDFKPTYGYVFDEDINKFDYWGYCDTDLIFGNIRKLLKDKDIESYDKIGLYGHMALIKNTKENNEMFKNKIGNRRPYRGVYSNCNGFAFDEELNGSINNIFLNNGKRCLFHNLQANIYRKASDFRLTYLDVRSNIYAVEEKNKAVFIYERGELYRIHKNKKTDYLYIHMQARNMKVKCSNMDYYKIIPNCFEDIEKEADIKTLSGVKTKHVNFHYFRHRTKNLLMKTKKKLLGNK